MFRIGMLDKDWPKTKDGKPINVNILKIGNPNIVKQACCNNNENNVFTNNRYGILQEDDVPAMVSFEGRNDVIAKAYNTKSSKFDRKARTKLIKAKLHQCVQECSA